MFKSSMLEDSGEEIYLTVLKQKCRNKFKRE